MVSVLIFKAISKFADFEKNDTCGTEQSIVRADINRNIEILICPD